MSHPIPLTRQLRYRTHPADRGGAPRSLARMAGFRNILQHGYVELDLEQLHRNARRFEDFSRFAECVVGYLER